MSYNIFVKKQHLNNEFYDVDYIFDVPSDCITRVKKAQKTGINRYNRDDGLVEVLNREFGERALRSSALMMAGCRNNQRALFITENKFRRLVKNALPQKIVEIGTWRGVSASVLAHYGDVITIDKYFRSDPLVIWHYLGLSDKITYFVAPTNELKKELIDALDFDFAFIDGSHDYREVEFDFEITKRCGRVLFHDYDVGSCVDVLKFVDTLPENELIKDRPFAYWTNA